MKTNWPFFGLSLIREYVTSRTASRVALFAAATFVASSVWSQSVYWSPSSGTMQEGKGNAIDLFYDSCEPDGQPTLPNVPDLHLTFRGQSNSRTIINGRLSAKTILNFQATPTELGNVTIPSFRVKTSEGDLTVPAARFEVVEATLGNSGVRPDEVFLSVLQTRDQSLWQGEVFELEYIAGAKQEYQLADLSIPQWNPANLVTEGLVDDQVATINFDGSPYLVKRYKANAMATDSGVVEVDGVTQDATVVVGRRRDFMFQEPVYDSFAIESDPLMLEVKPLPENAPVSFKGAVGSFSLESRVVPQEVQVGEPVTWTLELSGEGNWPAGIGVPARSVSSRFKAIQPETKNEFPENNLFTGSQTEDIVLIPTEAGTFDFGPVAYTYFDTDEETYKTIQIPATTVTVAPASGDASDPMLSGRSPGERASEDPTGSTDESFDMTPRGANAAQKPPQLLKEPMSGATAFRAPNQGINYLPPTVFAVACPMALWLLLAVRRSYVTDARKRKRKALETMRNLSRGPLPSENAKIREFHLKWRAAVSEYFEFDGGEPTPQEIAEAAKRVRGDVFAETWETVWRMSDEALFSTRDIDHREWLAKARVACGSCPGVYVSLSQVFRYKAWVPAFVAVALLGMGAVDTFAQEAASGRDPISLYDSGKFAASLEHWEAAVSESPNVFENRYNAGLAAAQSGDWGKAWAYWTSAFCLDPSNEPVAWNLRIAHRNTDAYDPILNELLEGNGLYGIVRLKSPAQWQRSFGTLIWTAGALLTLAVVFLYLRPVRKLAGISLLIAMLCGTAAYFSIWAYGKYEAMGNPDTLLIVEGAELLSVPTDLQSDQLKTTVGAGTIAEADKTFLGWVKVSLANGETGWLRQEKLIPLYGSLPQKQG